MNKIYLTLIIALLSCQSPAGPSEPTTTVSNPSFTEMKNTVASFKTVAKSAPNGYIYYNSNTYTVILNSLSTQNDTLTYCANGVTSVTYKIPFSAIKYMVTDYQNSNSPTLYLYLY